MSNRKRTRHRPSRAHPAHGPPPGQPPLPIGRVGDRQPERDPPTDPATLTPTDPAALTPTPNDPATLTLADPATIAVTVADAIESGAVDTYLRAIGVAIRRRQQQLVRKPEVDAAARFEVGDRVRLGQSVRPKYLRGATATVAGWAHKNVLIRLDHTIGRYPAGTEISVSPLGVRRDIP